MYKVDLVQTRTHIVANGRDLCVLNHPLISANDIIVSQHLKIVSKTTG